MRGHGRIILLKKTAMKHWILFSTACLLNISLAAACQKWSPALFYLTEKGCDTLVLTDGRRIAAEIERVTADEIFYTACDDPELRVFVVSRKKVAEVRRYQKPPLLPKAALPDEPDTYTQAEAPKPALPKKKKTELDENKAAERAAWTYMVTGLGIFALLFSLIGAPVSLAVAFSMMARFGRLWRRLGKHPKKRRLRVLLVIGLIFAILAAIGFFVLLYAVLTFSVPDLSGLSNLDFSGFSW